MTSSERALCPRIRCSDLTAAGNDQGQLTPMVRQLQGRYGRAPDTLLADAGFLKTAEIDELSAAACGTTLYLPPRIPWPGASDRQSHA